MSASATSMTTSPRRAKLWPAAVRSELSCRLVCRSFREAYTAGINPTIKPISVVIPSVKPSTVVLTTMAFTRGRPGGLSATSARTPKSANKMPVAPPSRASNKLSISTCRTIRVRVAPSAARTANSPRRCAPRASSRLVTLMLAIPRRSVTAPRTASRAGLTPAVTSS